LTTRGISIPMYPFKYQKPVSISEAQAGLAKDSESKLLAGGQSLTAAMKLRLSSPTELIDLSAIAELAGIRIGNGVVTIGAMTRHADVASSSSLRNIIPGLANLAGGIADRMVRSMGTLGGSLANNDPAADYPAVTLGLGAMIVTNERQIKADDFFLGMFETVLRKNEIITSVVFPVPKRSAYAKFKHPASRYATVGVFVADFNGVVRVAVTGAALVVFRATELEQMLSQRFASESIASIKVDDSALNSDLNADAAYRAHLITRMAMQAVDALQT
jgi:carbon-monoxide dehydrogenase medium subunit